MEGRLVRVRPEEYAVLCRLKSDLDLNTLSEAVSLALSGYVVDSGYFQEDDEDEYDSD